MTPPPKRPERPALTRRTERGRPGKPSLAQQLASVREAKATATQDVEAYLRWLQQEERYLAARLEQEQTRRVTNEARAQARQERKESEAKAVAMEHLLTYASRHEKVRTWLTDRLESWLPADDAETRSVFASLGVTMPTQLPGDSGTASESPSTAEHAAPASATNAFQGHADPEDDASEA